MRPDRWGRWSLNDSAGPVVTELVDNADADADVRDGVVVSEWEFLLGNPGA